MESQGPVSVKRWAGVGIGGAEERRGNTWLRFCDGGQRGVGCCCDTVFLVVGEELCWLSSVLLLF